MDRRPLTPRQIAFAALVGILGAFGISVILGTALLVLLGATDDGSLIRLMRD